MIRDYERANMSLGDYITAKKKYDRLKNILYYVLGFLYHSENILAKTIESILAKVLLINMKYGIVHNQVLQVIYFHSVYSGSKKYMSIANKYIKKMFYQIKVSDNQRSQIQPFVNVDNGSLIPNNMLLMKFIISIMTRFPKQYDLWRYAIEPLLFDWFIEWQTRHSERWALLKGQIDNLVNVYQTKVDSDISHCFYSGINDETGEYATVGHDEQQSLYDNPASIIEKIYYLELTVEEKKYYDRLGKDRLLNLYMCDFMEKLEIYKKMIGDGDLIEDFIDVIFDVWRKDSLCGWKLEINRKKL
jgi:hypothetical protein